MTKCSECDIVDLGISRVIKNGEEYELCPHCGAEDSVEEIAEADWLESMELDRAYLENELKEER